MIFYPEVWISLALLFLIGDWLSSRFYISASLPIFGLITISSFVGLFSVNFFALDLGLATLILTSVLALITGFLTRPTWKKLVIGSVKASAFVGVSASISFLTKYFGLAGVGFSDGFTIVGTGLWIQGLIEDTPLVGDRGLKRGLAMPAVQALGAPGEYLVGFIPLIFLVALICSMLIVYKTVGDKRLAIVLISALLIVLLSTEAVLRNLYLMNNHSLILLAYAVLILALLENKGFVFERKTLVSLLPVISTLGFARIDTLWMFAPLLIPLALVSFRKNKANGLLILASALIPLASWLIFALEGFTFGGYLGVALILSATTAIFFVANALIPNRWLQLQQLKKVYYWASIGLAVVIVLISNLERSINALFLNFVLGEGLWGVTLIALAVFAIVSSYFVRKMKVDDLEGWLIAAGLLALLLFVFAKLADGFGSGGITGGYIARSGWGDSLNRMLVAFTPFAFVFISSRLNRMHARWTAK